MLRLGYAAVSSPPLEHVDSVAIVIPSWVGDCVMATPVLRALREALPQARLIGCVRPGLDQVLAGQPWLDEIIVCAMKGLGGVRGLAGAIRSRRCRAVLLLPNSFRSALAARLSGAPTRIGYARDGRRWLLTHSTTAQSNGTSPIPAVDYYARLAEFALGVASIERRLELHVTEQEAAAASKLLQGTSERVVVLNPGANREDKRWPAERFAAVADELAGSHGVALAITGSPAEWKLLRSIVEAAKAPIINLAERGVGLGSLKAVLARAALLITNDTGPRHIAAALGAPVVTLFGPTDHRWTTLEGVRERILLAEPFLPEELMADRFPKACSIDRISVADVLSAAGALLRTAPRQDASGE